ncbi:MAG: 6-carboxytetrahydropterin synthase [Planctomycetota bacterium]
MFEATIERVFSAAHALRLPSGQFEPMHGHDWRVAVTVASPKLDAMDTVMDFHQLEALVEAVVGPWRNRCLNEVPPFADAGGGSGREPGSEGVSGGGGGLTVNPSAERVAERIAAAVSGGLPDGVWLREVSVGEAPGCTARYRADAESI